MRYPAPALLLGAAACYLAAKSHPKWASNSSFAYGLSARLAVWCGFHSKAWAWRGGQGVALATGHQNSDQAESQNRRFFYRRADKTPPADAQKQALSYGTKCQIGRASCSERE